MSKFYLENKVSVGVSHPTVGVAEKLAPSQIK